MITPNDRQDSSIFGELAEQLVANGCELRFQARGQSMAPHIQDGDILHVQTVDHDTLKAGDIVLFKNGGSFKAHRILKRKGECFITRGDTSMQIDGAIHRSLILGRVTAKESREHGGVVRLQGGGPRLRFFAREARKTIGGVLFRSSHSRHIAVAICVLLSAVTLRAQLTIDNTSGNVAQNLLAGGAGSVTLSPVPITIGAGANLLVVGVSFNNNGNSGSAVTGITFGAQTFSAANSFSQDPGNNLRVEIWYLVNPTAGTNNVSVTVNKVGSNKLGVIVGAISFKGADATSPIRGFASNFAATGAPTNSPTVTITSASPEIVVSVTAAPGNLTATATAAQKWNLSSTGSPAGQDVLGVGSTASGASSVTASETLSAASAWTIGAISVRPLEADLTITKTGPATVITGANFSYTLTIKNNGPRTATTVVVSDSIPSGVTFVSVSPGSPTCSMNSGLVTCSFATLANGASTTVTITVTAGPPALVTNTGNVTSAIIDPNTSNNSSSVTTAITYSTAARVSTFAAAQTSDGVLIAWKSSGEVHNLGYNIYRESNQGKVRLNAALIAGSALLMRDALEQHGARTYKWIDKSQSKSGIYWVEDIDLNGIRTLHGPITVQPGATVALAQNQDHESAWLSDTANSSPTHRAAQISATSHVRETVARPQPSSRLASIGFQLAAMPAVKIMVDHEGWYRVTQPQLVAAGFNADVDSSFLHLYAEGVEQPIRVLPGEGRFGPQAAIEFYGTAIDTFYSGQRVYWLVEQSQPGLRIPDIPTGSSGPLAQTFTQTLELKPRTTYFAALLSENTDNFFGPLVSSTPEVETLGVSNLAPGEGKLQIALQGVTQGQAHDVSVMLNGATLGDVLFSGQQEGYAEFPISRGVLTNGPNRITLTAQQGGTDLSLVDKIEVSFPHTFTAEHDFLKFSADAGESVQVKGFIQRPSRLVDVTNPLQPSEVEYSLSPQAGTYSLQANIPWTTAGQHVLIAVADDQIATPVSLALHRPSNLHGVQPGAEFVVITAPQFADQLAALGLLHRSEGQSVILVTTDAVYDEFNFGERTPFAIRNFLKTASEAWKIRPHYLVLAGDASLDPRNYLGFGDFDLVPTKLLPTAELKTASDDWFSDFNHTGLATLATGRLPARTEADAKLMVGKILNYAKTTAASWTTQALLVADRNDPALSFTQAAQSVQKLLPAAIAPNDVFANNLSNQQATQSILANLNAGQLFVNYNGHGSVEVWSGGLFDDTAASTLSNGKKLPFFAIMNCLNGFFQDVYSQSLAESLMLAPNGGAVAVWASSGLTQPDPQFAMNQTLVRTLFSQPAPTIGDAVLSAKASITDQDVRKTFILFGDPAMHLRTTTTKQK